MIINMARADWFRRIAVLQHSAVRPIVTSRQMEGSDGLSLAALERYFHGRLVATEEQSIQALQVSLLNSRISSLDINRAHMGISNLDGAGRGLFASRAIMPGELITCYPADQLSMESSKSNDISMAQREYEISIEIGGKLTRVIADSSAIDDPAYLGHMANDCASCRDPIGLIEYAMATAVHANADHVRVQDCHIATVASQRLSAGDEVFVSYGPGYWLTRHGFSAEVIEKAETELGREIRKGGELAKTVLSALNERGSDCFPPWILDCFEKAAR